MSCDRLILGNIYTLDEKVEAICVKNGIIQYAGSRQVAEKLCDDDTVVMDYGDNFVYPGFMEGHAHGLPAGNTMAYSINLKEGETLDDYVQIVKEYIEANPGRELYSGNGWKFYGVNPTAKMLDEASSDVPIVLVSYDGHSSWLNTAALAKFGFDKKSAKNYSPDEVRVDEDGNPIGYISEDPAISLASRIEKSDEEMRDSLLAWQEFAFSQGITAALEAYADYFAHASVKAYADLSREGKLKLRTYAVHTVSSIEDIDAVAEFSKNNSNEYFQLYGVKVFVDGVTEAHTAWLCEEYADQEGYYGVKRFDDHDKLVEFIKRADEHGLLVHFHAIGDGAVKFVVDAVSEAQVQTGNMDQRNAIAHLDMVKPEDIKRMADYNMVAVTPPLWTPKEEPVYSVTVNYIGKERADNTYPIKSFMDAGAVTTFHSDFPVSAAISIPQTIYAAIKRHHTLAPCEPRNLKEAVTAMDALKALTINAAYEFKVEDKLGTLEIGKIANMSVYDTDFLNCDVEDILDARLISTIVDGDEVFKG